MKRFFYIIMSGIIMAFPLCSDSAYKTALIGTWEWTGDRCDREGNCSMEIITDEQSREIFSREGLYISKNSRNSYDLRGNTINFASDDSACGARYADIVLIKNGMMLLTCGDRIRRYAKTEK